MIGSMLMFETILDNISEGVYVCDPSGKFMFVNKFMTNMRGIPKAKYMSMNIHDLLENKIISVCSFDIAVKEKREATVLQTYTVPGKKTKNYFAISTPIFDEFGKVIYVVTNIKDIDVFLDDCNNIKKDIYKVGHSTLKTSYPKSFVAESKKMRNLLEVADNIAGLDSTVLLTGESGVGKDVLANYIHNNSMRSKKEMIHVNCAALPENLLEAELFGYEKGSFTGALKSGKKGIIECADGSTLFLDEINSLPYVLQGKLLKSLETKTIQPIGSVEDKKVDFRLITATNKDLSEMVSNGEFRADLYYRLNVVNMYIPPLRERKDDIIPLANTFINYFEQQYDRKECLSYNVYDMMTRYDWPGNVRELRNFIERLIVMTPPNVKYIKSISSSLFEHSNIESAMPVSKRKSFTKEDIIEALDKFDGHRDNTAKYLGISRRTLQYKLKEFEII